MADLSRTRRELREFLSSDRNLMRPSLSARRHAVMTALFRSGKRSWPDVNEEVCSGNSRASGGESTFARARKVDLPQLGPKPIPGDGEPVLGEVAGLDGFYIAFTHSGATLGLIAGELLAREMLSGEKSPLLATFRPEQFASALVG
jgi:glycine/D-amino acid oxidase-like deaminating enzyme